MHKDGARSISFHVLTMTEKGEDNNVGTDVSQYGDNNKPDLPIT